MSLVITSSLDWKICKIFVQSLSDERPSVHIIPKYFIVNYVRISLSIWSKVYSSQVCLSQYSYLKHNLPICNINHFLSSKIYLEERLVSHRFVFSRIHILSIMCNILIFILHLAPSLIPWILTSQCCSEIAWLLIQSNSLLYFLRIRD